MADKARLVFGGLTITFKKIYSSSHATVNAATVFCKKTIKDFNKSINPLLASLNNKCTIHTFLDKHQQELIPLGELISNTTYTMYMCDCGIFSCRQQHSQILQACWGIATDQTASMKVFNLIAAMPDNKDITIAWLNYIYSMTAREGAPWDWAVAAQ